MNHIIYWKNYVTHSNAKGDIFRKQECLSIRNVNEGTKTVTIKFKVMRKLILLFFLSLFIASVNAQEKVSVSGKVIDNTGVELPGVSILEKGTLNGTVTNIDGDFVLETSNQSTLVFSFIGFVTQEIAVNGQTAFNVQMVEDNVGLEEVVVIGYGQLKVKDLTSSIVTIKSDELVKSPSGQAMQALQGKVAGVQIVSAGAPEASLR